jgi:hypothetical protein
VRLLVHVAVRHLQPPPPERLQCQC